MWNQPDPTELCDECGHAYNVHTNIDSVDDEYGNVAGTKAGCDVCPCGDFQ